MNIQVKDSLGRIYSIPKELHLMFLADSQDYDFCDSGQFNVVYNKFRVQRRLKPKNLTNGK